MLTYDDVRKILMLIEGSTLDEIHVELGDFKLDVRRHNAAPQPATREGQFTLAAPMLGTFHRATAPDVPPFVDVGTQVAPNDPLCIIQVMKRMNMIKAERAGRVAAILPENATLVEFGQTLIIFDSV